MAAKRGGKRKCDAFVQFGGLGNQSRQVFAHVSARGKHERMHDDSGRSLFDAAGKALGDCRLGDLHVCGLHDASGAEALPHECGNLIEQRIGLGAPTTVVDQENRAVAHPDYLGLGSAGVKKRRVLDTGGKGALHRAYVRTTEQVHVHQQWVELVKRDTLVRARR